MILKLRCRSSLREEAARKFEQAAAIFENGATKGVRLMSTIRL